MSVSLEETIAKLDEAKKRGLLGIYGIKISRILKLLRELQERRKQPEIIYCKDCENWDTTWQNDSAPNYHYCPMMDGSYSGDFYCAKAERRSDG